MSCPCGREPCRETERKRHVSVLGYCFACGAYCPDGFCPNA